MSAVFFTTAFSCSKKPTIGEPYILYEVHGVVYGSYYKVLDGAETITLAFEDADGENNHGTYLRHTKSVTLLRKEDTLDPNPDEL